jgi:hypothetical protein
MVVNRRFRGACRHHHRGHHPEDNHLQELHIL